MARNLTEGREKAYRIFYSRTRCPEILECFSMCTNEEQSLVLKRSDRDLSNDIFYEDQ